MIDLKQWLLQDIDNLSKDELIKLYKYNRRFVIAHTGIPDTNKSPGRYVKIPKSLDYARRCMKEGIDPITSQLIYQLFFTNIKGEIQNEII